MLKAGLWRPVRKLASWHVETQVAARRNALVASTALANRRREQDELEQFLADFQSGRVAYPGLPTNDIPASL